MLQCFIPPETFMKEEGTAQKWKVRSPGPCWGGAELERGPACRLQAQGSSKDRVWTMKGFLPPTPCAVSPAGWLGSSHGCRDPHRAPTSTYQLCLPLTSQPPGVRPPPMSSSSNRQDTQAPEISGAGSLCQPGGRLRIETQRSRSELFSQTACLLKAISTTPFPFFIYFILINIPQLRG